MMRHVVEVDCDCALSVKLDRLDSDLNVLATFAVLRARQAQLLLLSLLNFVDAALLVRFVDLGVDYVLEADDV